LNLSSTLEKHWGHTEFRPLQEDIIKSILEGNDVLVLLATGGGKSVCYQLPAIVKEGVTLVISPLISLMKDQVEFLNKKGINARAIYSGMDKREIDIVLDNTIYGNVKLLYMSPERINTELFQARYDKMNVNLIAIDEAHCISKWGYDFRPAYQDIQLLRELKKDVPIAAFTASATLPVIEDIQKKLLFKNGVIFRKSFRRQNLSYSVLFEEDKANRLLKILKRVPGSAIIYANTRKKTKDIAHFLNRANVSSSYYNAGLPANIRDQRQTNWVENKTRVMVATNAFGMGIDKPDVRLVIHFDPPSSIEAYFQEAGRAGRDQKKAFAILLYNRNDIDKLREQVITSFPDPETIQSIYNALGNYFQLAFGAGSGERYQFDIKGFSDRYDRKPVDVYNALRILELNNYLLLSESIYSSSKVKFAVKTEDLYTFQVANKSLDGFIKLLLRSHTGLFDQHIKINEQDLANKLKTSIKTIENTLIRLNSLNIIEYIPKSDLPSITYLTGRQEGKLVFSKETYHERKKVVKEQVEEMIHYFSMNKCRSQLLLTYFNEKNIEKCGICDSCLDRNDSNNGNKRFQILSNQIKKITNDQALSVEEIIERIQGHDDKVIHAIQWLIDNGSLSSTSNGKLKWRK